MSDFGHGMYAGGQEIASAPASVMHLPPIDPTSSLTRHNSYFSMAGSPAGSFDQMSAAAVAAAAAAAAGPYSPHAAGPGQYMSAARGGQQQSYPSTMMIGRFNMGGGMPPNATPGAAIPTSPQPSSSAQSQHPPPMGSSGTSMSVPTTPTRPVGMSRMNSHVQSSTTQRKRYLCTVCQKMFARPSTLSTHMHSHTGEKPYECTWDGCGKKFSVMSNLRRHQRIHERQRQKYAKAKQQEKHGHVLPGDVSDNDSSSGSTTPLVSQMLHSSIGSSVSQIHSHHHRQQQHHMLPPPPGFNQPSMLASHMQGGMSASLDMHHHGLSALHHPHPQQHHQHHLMASVASPPPPPPQQQQQQQHYHHHAMHHSHQQQVSLPDPMAKHSVSSNSINEDSATAVTSANEESVPMVNGASTASTNTISPTTPQSSGIKE
ncbi:hypothetical protein GGI20_002555 [Coemansia sp. BCRC 34301]|nr:hypothetical protein GGI20_002555 [Coemansia sp. BCRC 34301]